MPMVKCVKPQGTYLTWLDVTGVAERIGAKRRQTRPTRPRRRTHRGHARDDGGALVRQERESASEPGASYGLGGANHMRMNIGTSRKLVEQALTNMASALRSTSTSMV